MVVERQRPERVLLTRKDGTQLVLRNPVAVQDSLVGAVGQDRRTIALEDIDHLSLRRGNSLLPAILIPLGVVVGLGALIAAGWD